MTAEKRSWTKIKETHTSNPDISKICPAQSRPTPTGYPNQAFYLGLMEDQDFDKSTPVKRGNIERISQPSKQTKSNILPVTITKDTTLAAIFLFDINNLNTHSLFSKAAINQDKLITVLYTDAKVGGIDIKLILDSRSAIDHATTAQIITVNGNTKTLIEEIDNFPFEINGIQISIKNTQKFQLMFNEQHAQVPATCRHFKTQCTKESLIEFKDTSLSPTIETYQVSWADDYRTKLLPLSTWEEKGKGRAKEEPQLSLLGYVTLDQKNLFYQPPRLICVNCGKKLSTMGACIGDNKEWSTTTKYYCRPCLLERFEQPKRQDKEGTCDKASLNRLNGYSHDDHKIWRMTNTKIEELAPTRKEQKQRLADLNTKLCNHCLISCHFQYCDKCDLMFNPPPKILFPITELPEPEEEEVLITKDMLFQDPTEDTETKQYLVYSNLSKELELKWYSDNKEEICPKKAHDTNTNLKIALEISVSTMVQVTSRSSLAKKEIDVKGGIIDASYMGNIIMILQNNLDRLYKIESQEKIAQAIFLPLVKILQLTPVTTREELGLTAQGINGFGSSGKGNVLVNFMEEDSDQNLPKESYLFTPEEINKLNLGNLSTLQQMQLKVLLNQYANIFANENEFGHTDIMKHQIDTRDV
ncbi:hypothetical protein G9A89_010582 [Geosiphon pyriformis]|nr:hypothetical protein G9A89_010582 [Geosiphon pyriformis]